MAPYTLRLPLLLGCLLACLAAVPALAQKEGNNWFFGFAGGGLTFNTTPPSILTGHMLKGGREATVMSDECGRLLFYSEGEHVYNRRHQIMKNGAGLSQIGGGFQGAVSVPYPLQDSVYVLFIADPATFSPDTLAEGRLYYVLVDMRRENGLGAVVGPKNYFYLLGTNQMTPVRHANGRDYWLLGVQCNGNPGDFTNNNRIVAFLVDPAGVNTDPVVSRIPGVTFTRSQLRVRASPDGRKVIVAGFLDNFTGSNVGQGILLDFDNATGSITRTTLVPGGGFGADYDFSPDSRKVYAGIDNAVYQYQVNQPTGAAIAATRTEVPGSRQTITMRLAPDGRIYVATSSIFLDVIENPDAAGGALTYRRNVHRFEDTGKLPNNLASFTLGKRKDFRAAPLCAAGPVVFSPQVNYRVVKWAWNFGDPASGAANESTAESPAHTFSGPGTYPVRLITLNRCQEYDTVVRQVTVYPDPVQRLPDSTEVCYGEVPVVFTAQAHPLTRYRWNTGDTTTTLRASRTGWYTVTASNPCAVRTDSVWLRVLPRLRAAIPDDTVFCEGEPALIDGGAAAGPDAGLPGTTYLWSTGQTTRTVSLGDSGTYWVEIRNRCSAAVDTFRLVFVPRDLGAVIPNVFTPNDDGVNDRFENHTINRNYSLTVCDRWGRAVHQSRTPRPYWDGRVNGLPAQPGIYFYAIAATDCRGNPVVYRGYVHVLK